MPVQKLVANTTNEGLKRVREEYGRDALILKTVKRHGKVEFFVESEESPEELTPSSDDGLKNEYQEARLKMLSAIASESEVAGELPAIDESESSRPRQSIQSELTVKSLIEALDLQPAIAARLRGFKRIDEVIGNLSLMIKSPARPLEGIQAFVGPGGSGKTTSLIKLVVKHIMQHGENSCAIINCDRYRMGAQEQMSRLGELMGVDVLQVGQELSLNQAIANVHKRQLVVIDMPGLSMKDEKLKNELFQLNTSHYDIQRQLVLPANITYDSMIQYQGYFARHKNVECLLTRLDEVCSLGGAISFLCQTGLPLAHISDGTHIPEDIIAGNGEDITQRALSLIQDQFAKAGLSDLTKRDASKSRDQPLREMVMER